MAPEPESLIPALESTLRRHTVEAWFPRTVGREPGQPAFLQDFDAGWGPAPARPLSVVYQARMTWTAATLARRRPELEPRLHGWAVSGLDSLARRFVDPTGAVAFWEGRLDETHAYAVAFALLAAAAVHRLDGSASSAALARRIFGWLDAAAWEPERGGFTEALDPAGHPIGTREGVDLLGTPRGAWSSNAHLHLVEALTELLRSGSGDDAVVRDRLGRSVRSLEAVVEREGGRLHRHYDGSGRPLDRIRSFGHDVEAYHLVLDAREALGLPPATPLEALARAAFAGGLDRRRGGLCAGRSRWRRDRRKVWWIQAEASVALARLHAAEPDGPWGAQLLRLWRFVAAHMLDDAHGGWHEMVSGSGRRVLRIARAHAWKAAYHEVRGILETARLLHGRHAPGARTGNL